MLTGEGTEREQSSRWKDAVCALFACLVAALLFLELVFPVSGLPAFHPFRDRVLYACTAAAVLYCVWRLLRRGLTGTSRADRILAGLLILYIALRIWSLHVNGIPQEWNVLGPELFFLIAAGTPVFAREKSVSAVLGCFLVYDVAVLVICGWLQSFRPEVIEALRESRPDLAVGETCAIIVNPNSAGIIAGTAAVLFAALALRQSLGPVLRSAAVIGLIANLDFLVQTNCRSAEVGLIVTACAAVLVRFRPKLSVRKLLCAILICCIAGLIPIGVLASRADPERPLNDSAVEQQLDSLSSGRYDIWKSAVLCQEGHWLLGFGTTLEAARARAGYIREQEELYTVDESYRIYKYLGPHNGYLAPVGAAGVSGAGCFFLILLLKTGRLSDRRLRRHPEYLLLAYFFVINLFERLMITSVFFTFFLTMILLATDRDDGPEETDHPEETAAGTA
ncbi:MAG: O-antigen ligase family protein [Mogibacterium sp.]|nr:O-antigen ligase family protein [Mogibacterium sp.]